MSLFLAAIDRAADLGLNEKEMLDAAGVKYHNWWRAKNNKNAKRATSVAVLNKVEAALDVLEAKGER